MQDAYIVIEAKYDDSTCLVPTLAFESYKDACNYVNNRYGDDPVNRIQHIYAVPCMSDRDRQITASNIGDITDIIVQTINAYNK